MQRQELTLDDLGAIAALSADRHKSAQVFAAADVLVNRVIGHKLFTLMRVHEAAQEVERLYSSNTAAYPVGGRKPKKDTHWGRVVLTEGQVFVARDKAAVKEAFADYELIWSLGVGAIMNVPIAHNGVRLGTMNVSHEEHWFKPEDREKGKLIAALLVPTFLAG